MGEVLSIRVVCVKLRVPKMEEQARTSDTAVSVDEQYNFILNSTAMLVCIRP